MCDFHKFLLFESWTSGLWCIFQIGPSTLLSKSTACELKYDLIHFIGKRDDRSPAGFGSISCQGTRDIASERADQIRHHCWKTTAKNKQKITKEMGSNINSILTCTELRRAGSSQRHINFQRCALVQTCRQRACGVRRGGVLFWHRWNGADASFPDFSKHEKSDCSSRPSTPAGGKCRNCARTVRMRRGETFSCRLRARRVSAQRSSQSSAQSRLPAIQWSNVRRWGFAQQQRGFGFFFIFCLRGNSVGEDAEAHQPLGCSFVRQALVSW